MPLATVLGVEGFSFRDVSEASGVPKPTISALFGSKQELQLAVAEAARRTLDERVFAAVRDAAPGIARLEVLGSAWLDHLNDPELVGGCFFAASAFELDSRPGPLHDLVGEQMAGWIDDIARMIRSAQRADEVADDVDADDEAQVLFSIGVTANSLIQLGSPPDAADRARRSWARHLDRLRPTSPSEEPA
ncbi:MAG: TetR family transcriptional regulator [Actinomycetota bacterium]|nr:TetR family transcriptional regulator [Actinomycetota bacterium]